MKTFTRVFSLLLVTVLALSAFAGCSTKSTKLADPTPDANGNIELLIGGIGPLSGAYANYGISVKNGCQIAVDEINAAGGVNGMTFKLDFQDSAGDPKTAQNAYGNLIDKGMDISLGGVLSGETASIVAAAKKDGILVLTPSGSAKSAIEGNDCAFRVCFNDPQQGTVSADFIADNNLATKVAVFYANDVDYSKGLYETFKTQSATRGIEIVTEQTFGSSTNTDFSTQINAIKNSEATLVFIPIYAAEAAAFLTQAKAAGLTDVIFFGCDGIDGILEKNIAVEDVEGLMMLTPFAADSQDEDVKTFVSTYNDKFGKDPDQFAADGYDAIYAIKAAIEEAGLKKDDVTDFHSRLVAAMTKITVDGVTGTMTWTDDGETQKAANALVYKDGVAVAYKAE